jgi:dihydroorotate dehydrogenase (fumarate)
MNLGTTYLGLTLAHPFIAGASPLADHLDTLKRLEDGGAAAIVLRSLFEEQITMDASAQIHHMDPLDREFARALSGFPKPETYPLSPSAYLEHIRRAKEAVRVPIVASLNGVSAEAWARFAKDIQQAGADALELNIYEMAADVRESGPAVERRIRDLVIDIRHSTSIPVAVKLGPFFTAFGHIARELDTAGANGLVIFNRFYQQDIDVTTMAPMQHVDLSTSAELLLRLRWLIALRGHVRCSLAVSGGVATPIDGIKAILAGADAVQLVSAILRNGPGHFAMMRQGLVEWMESKGLTSIDQVRGAVAGHPQSVALYERGTYIRTLQSWTP